MPMRQRGERSGEKRVRRLDCRLMRQRRELGVREYKKARLQAHEEDFRVEVRRE